MNVRSCRRAIEGQPLLRSIVLSNANSFGRFLKACPKRIVLDGFTAVVLHGEHFTLLRRAKGKPVRPFDTCKIRLSG